MIAKDIMTSPVTTIEESHHIKRAIDIINSSKIGAVPVVDDEGKMTGIVSEGDLMRRRIVLDETHGAAHA